MVKSFTEELNEELKKRTESDEEIMGKLHAEAEVPHPLMLDEVSASFISWLRVQSWEDLGTDFGGYRIGRILAYILDVLNEKIEDSTAATIKVDVPLYEQCSTVSCKCGGKYKNDCGCYINKFFIKDANPLSLKKANIHAGKIVKSFDKFKEDAANKTLYLIRIRDFLNEPRIFTDDTKTAKKIQEVFTHVLNLVERGLGEVSEQCE